MSEYSNLYSVFFLGCSPDDLFSSILILSYGILWHGSSCSHLLHQGLPWWIFLRSTCTPYSVSGVCLMTWCSRDWSPSHGILWPDRLVGCSDFIKKFPADMTKYMAKDKKLTPSRRAELSRMRPQAVKQAWHTNRRRREQSTTTTTTTAPTTADRVDTLSTPLKVHNGSALPVDALVNNFIITWYYTKSSLLPRE